MSNATITAAANPVIIATWKSTSGGTIMEIANVNGFACWREYGRLVTKKGQEKWYRMHTGEVFSAGIGPDVEVTHYVVADQWQESQKV